MPSTPLYLGQKTAAKAVLGKKFKGGETWETGSGEVKGLAFGSKVRFGIKSIINGLQIDIN